MTKRFQCPGGCLWSGMKLVGDCRFPESPRCYLNVRRKCINLLKTGFCNHCGATYPDRYGQGKCEHCIPAFEVIEEIKGELA